ncbi:MAG TPA: amidase [Planctomycetes bacterium]|nr:amidase [Planctomycetota bacterium]
MHPLLHAATLLLLAPMPQPRPQDSVPPAADDPSSLPDPSDVRGAARTIGAHFTDGEIELMLPDLHENLASFEALRGVHLDNSVAPALTFLPSGRQLEGTPVARLSAKPPAGLEDVRRPVDLAELAWLSIPELSRLIHARAVSCEEVTEFFLARLTEYDPTLHFLIERTDERARAQARALDRELDEGHSRGLLHGIPWVAKDLLAVRGTRTTWGAAPFRDQVIDADATVVERLDDAGAVLIAKVSLGALAWGDVWFGGKTRNPWNPEQGSSGSSAGPASAVAAGCAPFGIGSETLGSIVSPSTRCGNSSLRPTFGRVPRGGAMALSWSMDKLGPICRSAVDAGIVFDAIHGAGPNDAASVWAPLDIESDGSVEGWRVGYVEGTFDEDSGISNVLDELRSLGVELVPIELPDYPVGDMVFVLSAEAGAAFDEFSIGGLDDELVRQTRDAWPNVFRLARLIPAVDYLRANRLRALLTRDLEETLRGVRALVHPSFAAGLLTATNLTGHPTFVAPASFRDDGTPRSVSFTARHFGETDLLRLVRAWQASTHHHERHPAPELSKERRSPSGQ